MRGSLKQHEWHSLGKSVLALLPGATFRSPCGRLVAKNHFLSGYPIPASCRGGFFMEHPRLTISGNPHRGRTIMSVSASEAAIEAELNTKGLNAPRLNPQHIDAQIVAEQYYVFPGTTLTVCALTLRNGFHVVGESAAASPANFDEAIGKRISRDNARNKIWALEGYLLRSKLVGM